MSIAIHPTAFVSDNAHVADNVTIGPYTIVHPNVELGAGTTIGSHCEIGFPTPLAEGQPLVIGPNSLIRSHSVFYMGSTFGEGLVTGHHVTVRERTSAGKGLQIGSLGDIQGHCTLGHYVKTQSSVTIGQKATIGNFVWMFPGVLLTNDPNPPSNELLGVTIEDYVVVAVKCTLLPGVRVGKGSFLTAHSLITQDVPENSLVSGSPAQRVARATDLRLKSDLRKRAYPWRERFIRGYPDDVVRAWANGSEPVIV